MRDAPPVPVVRVSAAPPARRSARPWMIASILAVVVVLGGTWLGRAVVVATTPPVIVPPPALPLMDAIAVAQPEARISLAALDSGNGHLVALAAERPLACPPVGACPAPLVPDAFVVLDGRTGESLASTPLGTDPATAARVLVADTTTHRAYAVAPQAVTIFSTDSGARVGGFALPAGLAASAGQGGVGAALISAGDTLVLATAAEALLLRADSGQVVARATLSGDSSATLLDGPIVDSARGRLYLLLGSASPTSQPQLIALDTHALHTLGQFTLPAGARLGPPDAADANLSLFGADGTTWRLPLDALASQSMGSPPALTPLAALRNAIALGQNPTLGHQYVADAGTIRVFDASGPIAMLPLAVRASPSVPLMVDASQGLLYLPSAYGGVVIVQDSADPPTGYPLSPITAVLLAQRALAATWSDPRDPPLVTPDMFPLRPSSQEQAFWTEDATGGWQGPSTGQTITREQAVSGGGYRVTLTIIWNQLFWHEYDWVWSVAPDGTAREVDTIGTAVP